MKPFFIALAFILVFEVSTSAPTVHEIASVDLSASEWVLGMFSPANGTRAFDLKLEDMSVWDKDILIFFTNIHEIEAKEGEVSNTRLPAHVEGVPDIRPVTPSR